MVKQVLNGHSLSLSLSLSRERYALIVTCLMPLYRFPVLSCIALFEGILGGCKSHWTRDDIRFDVTCQINIPRLLQLA